MDKPRLIEVTGDELDAIRADGLGAPLTFSNRVDNVIHFWADADELRAWRSQFDTGAVE